MGKQKSISQSEPIINYPLTPSQEEDKIIDSTESIAPKLAKGAGITFLGDAFGKGINFISQIIIARLLGSELFGLYALGLVIFNIAQTLAVMGLSQGALRYISIYSGEGNKVKIKETIIQAMGIPFLLGILIGIIIFFMAENLAGLFGNPELEGVIKIIALGIPFMAAMMVAIAITRGFKKMQYFVYVKNIFHPLTNIGLVILLFYTGYKLSGAVLAWVIAAVLGFFLSLFFVKREIPDFFSVKVSKYTSKELIKFSWPLVLVGFLQMLFIRTDIIMLGYFRSASEVGIYNAASQVVFPLTMIMMAFNAIFSPIIAEYHKQRKLHYLNNILKMVAKWTFILTIPIFIVILVASKELLSIFGNEYLSGWKALLLISIFHFISITFGPISQVLVMSGKQHFESYCMFGCFLLNIVLNFLLIPKHGINGAAIATGISVTVMQLVRLAGTFYYLKLWPFSKKYLKGLIALFSALFVTMFFRNLIQPVSTFSLLTITIAITASSFLLVMLILKLDNEDKMVLSAIGKYYNRLRK